MMIDKGDRDISDMIRFEDDDPRAEYIYQRIFRFHDVQQSCLGGIGEIFGMRRSLSEVKGRPLGDFIAESHKASVCEVEQDNEGVIVVRLRNLVVEYEPERKCLAVGPGRGLSEKVLSGSGDRIRLKTQRYWITATHFPPLSVFMEMENDCQELVDQYDLLEQWKDSEECRTAESVVRRMLDEFVSVLSACPEESDMYLSFGFPQEDRISLSLSESLASTEGQSEVFPLMEWKEGLYGLLGRRLELQLSLVRQSIERELMLRTRLERCFVHETSVTDLVELSVENRGRDAREQYYLGLMLRKAKGQSPVLRTGAYLDRCRFFVQGRRATSKLVESAEKCNEAERQVVRDDDGKAIALHFRFELFDAVYDIPDCTLKISLHPEKFSSIPVEGTEFEYQMTRPATHFSIRSLCDCHYRMKEALAAVKLVWEEISGERETFEERTERLRSFLLRTGGMLVPADGEDPFYRLVLYPQEGSCERFGLDSCGGPFDNVTLSLPVEGFNSALTLWWSQWKLSVIKASKIREQSQKDIEERYMRVLSMLSGKERH